MNRKSKGNRNERKCRDKLLAAGYAVTKSGGSFGAFDLIGIGPTDIVLVQVKTNKPCSKAEREAMQAFQCPVCCCSKQLWIYRDYVKEPEIIEIV